MTGKQIYDLSELFEKVQMTSVLEDGKTFVDCIPKFGLDEIEGKYQAAKDNEGFDLKKFVYNNFQMPPVVGASYESDKERTVEENIRQLWNVLTRTPASEESSLISLPYTYIVPGGRFREIYYWDSYFTMLGLQQHGRVDLIETMIDNFAFLLRTYGHIPNGNRRYYMSRSQPPFFALMITLLADLKNDDGIYIRYKKELELEHAFWLQGASDTKSGEGNCRVAKMADGELLNRYYDSNSTPRQESYAQDVHVSESSQQAPEKIFTHIRAGAESGWDFSSRWFADGVHMETIQTTDIVPVDLNCLLYSLELTIAKATALAGEEAAAKEFQSRAAERRQAIQKYCWNKDLNFFTDYNLATQQQKHDITAAGLFPLFVKLASAEQAKTVAAETENYLLKDGGIVTTTNHTGQQWDAPNGWAPLQWIAYVGLKNYQHHSLAKEIAGRWLSLNEKVFRDTGKLMEKYNVEDLDKPAGGGEYPGQDGFGWTNGTYVALKKSLLEI